MHRGPPQRRTAFLDAPTTLGLAAVCLSPVRAEAAAQCCRTQATSTALLQPLGISKRGMKSSALSFVMPGGSTTGDYHLYSLHKALNETDGCLLVSRVLEKYYLSTMYSLEFILGFIGNTIVVFGYIFCLKNWKSGNIYLFNLSLSDLLFLCTLPILVNSYSKDQWTKENVLCHSNRFLLHANLYSSILFLTVISFDRYMLIKYPFREHFLQKRKAALIVSVVIWIGVILELLPLMYFLEPITPANNYKCLDYASSGDPTKSLIYSMFLTVFGFLIPLLIMCCFYVKMVLFLKNRNEQATSLLTLEKPLTLVILAMVVFSLLFTPYHVMRNVRIASRIPAWNVPVCTQSAISIVYIITRPIAFLNSAINPVFYFLMGDHFREMLMAKVRQLLSRLTTTGK